VGNNFYSCYGGQELEFQIPTTLLFTNEEYARTCIRKLKMERRKSPVKWGDKGRVQLNGAIRGGDEMKLRSEQALPFSQRWLVSYQSNQEVDGLPLGHSVAACGTAMPFYSVALTRPMAAYARKLSFHLILSCFTPFFRLPLRLTLHYRTKTAV